ncbi:MAG: SpoIID/LytB domain-containing protein, partial [Phycisphaerae bacterium]|nr:SpoIID/LytB domain-containing protein [Phycisphaerae bacterium]
GCPGPSLPVGVAPTTGERSVRDIRVLLAVSQSDVRVGVWGGYTVYNHRGEPLRRGTNLPWVIVSSDGGVVLGDDPLESTWVKIVPEQSGTIVVSEQTSTGWSLLRRFGGSLRLLAQEHGTVKVINLVDVETYTAGVLPGEIYPGFHREAFRAQAIAARTYALYEMSINRHKDYDVVATESSQVYQGVSDTAVYHKAWAAIDYTRGLVCTWASPEGERIFCTYFSSACGGVTQSVADGKGRHNIPPLAGDVRCDYCRIAKGEAYRWKQRSISLEELSSRVARRYPQAAELGRFVDVCVVRKSAGGRALRIRLIGDTGRSFELPGENFRLAVGSRVMRSTNCRIRVADDAVLFEDGKGFGHGMGLCQWGMEGQARQGRTAAQILRFYYPQSHLTRAY